MPAHWGEFSSIATPTAFHFCAVKPQSANQMSRTLTLLFLTANIQNIFDWVMHSEFWSAFGFVPCVTVFISTDKRTCTHRHL